MTNKEKYKKAFSGVHISDDFSLEVKTMTNKKQRFNQMIAGIVACILLVGGSSVAYATDLGGIQRTLQLWIDGDQTEVSIEFEADGSYAMEYVDSEGKTINQGGGGVAINADGSERPLTQEEIIDHLNDPDVRYEEDGSVWIDYFDQKIDITQKFDDDGICYAKLSNGQEVLYVTIKYQEGMAYSPKKYLSPSSFNE